MLDMLNCFLIMAGMKVKEFFTDEEGAVDIVAIVVLIGIAVVLAVLFKDNIAKVLNNLFKSISDTANDAMNTFGK